MKRIYLLMLILVFSGMTQKTGKTPKSTPEKPNVILIMADDMGKECLSSYGSLSYQTPQLDQLASEGIKFTRCFSQPLCTPSRVKIMTGKYNYRNYEHFGYLNPNQKTIGNLMKDAGYATCLAGKWQLNGIYHDLPGNQDLTRPYQFGFDTYCLWQVNTGKQKGERYADPLIVQNEKELPRDPDSYGPDIFYDFIEAFIEQNQNKPFFVYYPMVLVHDPFVPTPDSPEWQDPSRRYENDTAYFADMVAYTDKIVGNLKQKLKELDLDQNTIIMFTGDNGTHPSIITQTNEGPYRGAKGKSIDAGNHVPFIVNWPTGIRSEGRTYDGLVEFSDFYPTLADLAGVDSAEPNDGESFYEVLTGEDHTPRQEVYIYYDPHWGHWSKSVFTRTESYKLYEDGRFFEVANDKLEQNPLSEAELDQEQQQIRSRLQEVLDKNKQQVID